MIARRDKAAVARQQRQFGGERPREAIDQGAVFAKPRFGLRQRIAGSGTRPGCDEDRADRRGLAERVAQRGEVARAAATEAEAAQRALDIGDPAQPLAQIARGSPSGRERTARRRAGRGCRRTP